MYKKHILRIAATNFHPNSLHDSLRLPQLCYPGTFSNDANGATTCENCPNGKASGAGASTCSSCPAGYECIAGGAQVPCPVGKFSNSDSACLICDSGYKCPGGSDHVPCAPGSSREDSEDSSDESRAKCITCPAGRFQPNERQESCLPCTAGHFCPESSTAPVPCGSVALYCPPESPIVIAVSPGYFTTPETGDTLLVRDGEEPCPAGFACTGGRKNECVAGSTYQPEPSKSSCLTCSSCPAGTYETSACTATSDIVCEPCPAGFACLEGVKASCTASSTYQPDPSKSSCLTCSSCPAGTYETSVCTTTSDSVCAKCLAGSASMGITATACDSCTDEGEYSNTDGAPVCKTSPAGHKPTDDHTNIELCPKNTFSFGATNECTPCPPGGHSQPGSSACEQCLTGRYFSEPDNKCELCPKNTYTISGATDISGCTGCPPGGHSDPGSGYCEQVRKVEK